MAAFKLHDLQTEGTEVIGIEATSNGGFVALFETFEPGQIDGNFALVRRYNVVVFDEGGVDKVVKLGSDFEVFPGKQNSPQFETPAILALDDGGFAVYQTNRPFEGFPSTQMIRFDAEGVEVKRRTLNRDVVDAFGMLDLGLGPDQPLRVTHDALGQLLFTFNTANGIILSEFDDASDFFGELLAFDAGYIMPPFIGPDLDMKEGLALRNVQVPTYTFDVPAGENDFLLFSAGNLLVIGSGDAGDDIIDSISYTLRKPNDDAFTKTVRIGKAGKAQDFVTSEIDGVGFAVFTAFIEPIRNDFISSADIRIFDFDGDLIASKAVQSIGPSTNDTVKELGLTELNNRGSIKSISTISVRQGSQTSTSLISVSPPRSAVF